MRTVKLELGGLTLDLAPTPLVRLEAASKEEGEIRTLCVAVFWGLRRAGSEVTLEFVLDNVDNLNRTEVLQAFNDVNSLQPKESAAAGEAKAGEAS